MKDAEGKSKYQNPDINTVLNRTLIQAPNRRISRMRPSEYLAKLVPSDRKQEIMATHLIDEAALVAMERDDYEGFLQAREKRIMAALMAVTHPALPGVVEMLPKPDSGPVPEYKVREISELIALVEEVGENAKNWPSED
ncbi:MAG: hypothetical protein ACUVRC_09930 [Desulfotomaculales bacterium]